MNALNCNLHGFKLNFYIGLILCLLLVRNTMLWFGRHRGSGPKKILRLSYTPGSASILTFFSVVQINAYSKER